MKITGRIFDFLIWDTKTGWQMGFANWEDDSVGCAIERDFRSMVFLSLRFYPRKGGKE